MAYRAAILGGSGYTGAELLRLLAGAPRDRRGARHRRLQRRGGRGVAVPVAAGGLPGARVRAASTPAHLDGVDVVFAALPHGESQRILPELVDRVGARRRPRRRLPAPGRASTRPGTASRTRAPSADRALRLRAPRAVPRRPRDRAPHVAAPGCYPTSRGARARAVARTRPRRADRHRRRRDVGRLRPRARALGAEPVQRGERERDRLRPARPPPHR